MAKIAILYELLGRSRGGIESWIFHASKEMLNLGHKVILINTQKNTPPDAAVSGITIITLKVNPRIPIIDHIIKVIYYVFQLKKILNDFDFVLARSFTMALAAGNILGSNKAIYVNAAPYSLYGQKKFREKITNLSGIRDLRIAISSEISKILAFHLEKRAILINRNIFLSRARMKETISFFDLSKSGADFRVVPGGVDTERFKPLIKEQEDEQLRLISVSRLAPDKNIQCVIEAVEMLILRKIPIKLTIIGEGHYENELRHLTEVKRLRDVIFFAGRQEKVEDWYSLNRIFVLPSLYEGFGTVYLEAMACGLPCIAISNQTGKFSVAADEIIDHGIDGYLMKDNDPSELSYYIKELYENPVLLRSMSKNARLKSLKYNWKSVISDILNENEVE